MSTKNIFADILERVRNASAAVAPGLDLARVTVEPPRDPSHGDIATNAAMVLAKDAGRKPRELAETIAEKLCADALVAKVDVAGPGFINLTLKPAAWIAALRGAVQSGSQYGASDIGGGVPVNVEYVSANPTGPMHVGHGRGAVFGDALANLLASAGFKVTREYYVNDAGAQVDVLARSAYLRYREALGETIGPIPEGLYPGEYLRDVGRALAARDGGKWREVGEQIWLTPVREFAIAAMMILIGDDLAALGVKHATFASERAVVARGVIDEMIGRLKDADLVYRGTLEPPKGMLPDDWEPREQLLFRSTKFGDDVDRPLQKSDGSWTYFASDIAYHLDKIERGFGQ